MKVQLLLLVLVMLGGLPRAEGLDCYVGSETSATVKSCLAGQCSLYVQNSLVALGCYSSSQCTSSVYCCSTDLCNALNSTDSLQTLDGVHPSFQNVLGFSSSWSYFVGASSPSNLSEWADNTFDDSPWLKSKAPFGFTDGTVASLAYTSLPFQSAAKALFFRRSFTLESSTFQSTQRLAATILFNDGVAVFVNGNRVFLSNLNPGATYLTSAVTQKADVSKRTRFFIETSNLLIGDNTVAVQVHRSAASGDNDIYFDLELLAVIKSSNPFPKTRALVPKGADWSYLTSGITLSNDFWKTSSGFDTSSWSSGKAPFGDSSAASRQTTLSYTLNPIPVTYFRRVFTVSPNLKVSQIFVNLRSDNGFVMFINGQEVARGNLGGATPVSASTQSILAAQTSRKSTYFTYSNLASSAFTIGDNVIAFMVFHANESTPNISFDLEMLAVTANSACQPFDVSAISSLGSYPYDFSYSEQPCVFPFIYNGVSYSDCTTAGKSKAWCSLTSNLELDGVWGYCNTCTTSCESSCIDSFGNRNVPSCLVVSSDFAYCDPSALNSPTAAPSSTQASTPTPTPTKPSKDTQSSLVGGIVGAGVVVIVILVCILALYLIKDSRKKKKAARMLKEFMPLNGSRGSASQLTMNMGTAPALQHDKKEDYSASQFEAAVGMTLVNTTMEKALPGFLLLTNLEAQIRLGKTINKGGNGTLYEGIVVDPNLKTRISDEKVAVKKIEYPNTTAEDALQAFHHEITSMWSLSFHANVISLLAYDDISTSFVTPLYDGDLDHFLHKDTTKLNLDDRMLMYCVQSIVSGMKAVHDIGVIHRDLKPGNILLKFRPNQLPEIVICDFGIARIADNHSIMNQKKLELFGLSPRYAAPETFARLYMSNNSAPIQSELEKLADVYSFGVMVWEIMSRKIPWEGLTSDQIEVNVRGGKTLPDPKEGTTVRIALAYLYRACRAMEPTARPSFTVILQNMLGLSLQLGFDYTKSP